MLGGMRAREEIIHNLLMHASPKAFVQNTLIGRDGFPGIHESSPSDMYEQQHILSEIWSNFGTHLISEY